MSAPPVMNLYILQQRIAGTQHKLSMFAVKAQDDNKCTIIHSNGKMEKTPTVISGVSINNTSIICREVIATLPAANVDVITFFLESVSVTGSETWMFTALLSLKSATLISDAVWTKWAPEFTIHRTSIISNPSAQSTADAITTESSPTVPLLAAFSGAHPASRIYLPTVQISAEEAAAVNLTGEDLNRIRDFNARMAASGLWTGSVPAAPKGRHGPAMAPPVTVPSATRGLMISTGAAQAARSLPERAHLAPEPLSNRTPVTTSPANRSLLTGQPPTPPSVSRPPTSRPATNQPPFTVSSPYTASSLKGGRPTASMLKACIPEASRPAASSSTAPPRPASSRPIVPMAQSSSATSRQAAPSVAGSSSTVPSGATATATATATGQAVTKPSGQVPSPARSSRDRSKKASPRIESGNVSKKVSTSTTLKRSAEISLVSSAYNSSPDR